MAWVNQLKPKLVSAPGKSLITQLLTQPNKHTFFKFIDLRLKWNPCPQVSDFVWRYSPLEDLYQSMNSELAEDICLWCADLIQRCEENHIPAILECIAISLEKADTPPSIFPYMFGLYRRVRQFSFHNDVQQHWQSINHFYQDSKPECLVSFIQNLNSTKFLETNPEHWHIYDHYSSPELNLPMDELIALLPQTSNPVKQYSLDPIGFIEFRRQPYWIFDLTYFSDSEKSMNFLWIVNQKDNGEVIRSKPIIKKPRENHLFSLEILTEICNQYYWPLAN